VTLVGSLRARLYASPVARLARELEVGGHSDADRQAFQLERLNQEWARLVADVPHYANLQKRVKAPAAFSSLEEFARALPVVRREDVQSHLDAMRSHSRRPQAFRITGGSTASPVQLPAWHSEYDATRNDFWVARGWYGVTPGSRLFLLWGHSHLLGTGWRAWIRARRLELSDRLLGYHRFSAYDLRPEAMERAGEALLRFRPDYLLGYSTALDLFARANVHRRDFFRACRLRMVVATAESFPALDSADRLRDLFGCPVAMEYGAVETGLLAHSHPSGGFRVFWRSHLLEAPGVGVRRRLLVTSLYPRAFPLVRYEIGDEVELASGGADGTSLAVFERVVGRNNDYVELPDGTLVHSEAFSHAVRPCPAIRGYQIVQKDSTLELRYTSDRALDTDQITAIQDRLGRVHVDLRPITFERVDTLEQTVAGKTRMVVRS
jgi:phenylacetate-coenzyme A ligase PaaK-like adenylate-forming protein